jgi:hypothetical protein
MLAGVKPSIGSVGDALDNGLAETTIGLDKSECIREGSPLRSGPIRTLADHEHITYAWVSWYTSARLMHRLGRRPPAEVETRITRASTPTTTPATGRPGMLGSGACRRVWRGSADSGSWRHQLRQNHCPHYRGRAPLTSVVATGRP